MLNTNQMLEVLKDVPVGSIVFVSYSAGRSAGPGAEAETARAKEEGLSLRHYTGKLEGVHQTKRGQHYFTLWVEERDSVKDGQLVPGNFRAFNPALGRLHALEVIQRAEEKREAS